MCEEVRRRQNCPAGRCERSSGAGGDRVRKLLIRPLLIVLLIPLPLVLWFRVVDQHVWQIHHAIGLALTVVGTALWFAARSQLGASFTMNAEAHRLVTHGVYHYVRHPIYIGAEILSAGLFIFMRLYPLLLLACLAIPWQRRRAQAEEDALESAFGEDYRAYRRRTWL